MDRINCQVCDFETVYTYCENCDWWLCSECDFRKHCLQAIKKSKKEKSMFTQMTGNEAYRTELT